MCFEFDAVPPIAPIQGAAVRHEHLTLTAEDGTDLAAFLAHADNPSGAAVVILPDVRGLFPFYEELALRFAEQGHDAVAFDYFGRTAGVGRRGADFDFWPHVEQTTLEGIRQDTAAAVAAVRTLGDRRVFTVGFCFGGSSSWHQAASGHGLAGAIGFYGHPNRAGFPQGTPPVIDRIGEIECPILGLMGGADPSIPQEEVDAFRSALDGAGIRNEIVSYPGAPHSFFDRAAEQFADASADAWSRILEFIGRP